MVLGLQIAERCVPGASDEILDNCSAQLEQQIIMGLSVIIITVIVFLLVIINFFVNLVLYIGEDYHVIDQIKIYEVFEEPIYKKVRSEMMNKNYTILIGDDNSGVKNFIQHQANLQTLEGRAVVVKRYQSPSSSKRQFLKTIKETRFYLEMALGLEREERTQVFFINEAYEIPYEEVEFIRKRYPADNIIIVCPKDIGINLQGFKNIVFPPVTEKLLKVVALHFYRLKKSKVDEIFESQGHSIERIFNYFKRQAKKEDIAAEDLIEIEQIEDMNQMSHQIAEHQQKKLLKKKKASENKVRKSQSNKQTNKIAKDTK